MIYVVQQGDRLPQLAQRFGVSQARLRSDNGLGSDQPLVPGQALAVLVPTATYTVRPGDTLWGIARQTGVPLRQLLQYMEQTCPVFNLGKSQRCRQTGRKIPRNCVAF